MKQQISQLAAFGGPRLFPQPCLVGQPDITAQPQMLERIQQVFASGWLTNNGPVVQQFEQQICELTGAAHCIAVCNGTMALQMMAKACGLTGEVIVPAFTFIGTAHALEWIGLTPVFADIDPATHTLDPDSVERCITPRTSGILGVHLWGNPCDIDGLQQIADRHHLQLLFDACHAFGCRHHGRSIGTFGRAEAFSFHATKFVHSLEGGAVLTQSAALAQQMRLQRNFGITGYTSVESSGTNGKLNDVSAAVGLTSLELMPERLAHNHQLQAVYRQELENCPGVRLLPVTADEGGNGQYVVLQIDAEQFGLQRDTLLELLRAEGVFARSYFVPGCHQAPPYVGKTVHHPTPLPHTENTLKTVLQCPVGPTISIATARRICLLLQQIQRLAVSIQDCLNSGWQVHCHPEDPARAIPRLPLAG